MNDLSENAKYAGNISVLAGLMRERISALDNAVKPETYRYVPDDLIRQTFALDLMVMKAALQVILLQAESHMDFNDAIDKLSEQFNASEEK